MSAADAIDVALRVAAAIEDVGGQYFVGGSVASSLQGEPRSTNDVDMVIELPLGRVDALANRLGDEFEVDTEMLRNALLHGQSCNIFHLPTVMKIEFARRRPQQVRQTGESLVLKTPEDTVLRKLLWYEQGGRVSDRQWLISSRCCESIAGHWT
jgi:hypothetical protein